MMRVLSIDGGGYLGLASAAFIQGIEDHFKVKFSNHFDLFCGTSTGAILALSLANGRTGAEIVELYKNLGVSVFGKWSTFRKKARSIKSLLLPRYSQAGLELALRKEFGETKLCDLTAKRKMAMVTAFCCTTGRPRVFKTDHSSNLTRHGNYLLRDIALASAAAPTYFPMSCIHDSQYKIQEYFCDGGVVANHPALLGFVEAVSELKVLPSEVQLLSISTPRTDLADQPIRVNVNRGLLAWGPKLAAVFTDANSMIADQVLRRLMPTYGAEQPRYERVEMQNKQLLDMDRVDSHATELLVHIGSTLASCNTVRSRLKPFFD